MATYRVYCDESRHCGKHKYRLMGAVGYHWNNEHLKPNASKGKMYIYDYIIKKLKK